MLHLLPIRIILQVASAIVALSILAAVYLGWFAGADSMQGPAAVMRWSSAIALLIIMVVFAFWRWVPFAQRLIFPYLGGHWRGVVKFAGDMGEEQRSVTLEVKHTLLGLRLLLDSDESVSWTLAVHAERHVDFERFRLYYVYLNERKEGRSGAGDRYRGVAIMRVETGRPARLLGDYFTETHRRGTIELSSYRPHPWWKLWR